MKLTEKSSEFLVPEPVVSAIKTLKNKGFEAYLIGGCVRDLIIGRRPKDWDITTNAEPREIIASFEKTFYENEYGTVGVVTNAVEDETLRVIEVTPYRLEAAYSDYRRPDSVNFSNKLEDDLMRRDFTINSIALDISLSDNHLRLGIYKGQLVDPFGGRGDIARGIVRAVGDPHERFGEDALRMLRAIRIATELGFTINVDTEKAIEKQANLLEKIAKERIRDEFVRIIESEKPMVGLILAHRAGILNYILPELEEAMGVKQNRAHSFDVFEHSTRTLQHAADKKWSLEIRLAALLHDIGKPASRRWGEEKKDWTFHGHDVVGERVSVKILSRLLFPKKLIEKVSKLVRWHMFFSDTEVITLSAVRRLVANVGKENVWDLMNLRICDRIGTGRPKESPYRLRKYNSMVEEAMRDPISVGMLKINGGKIMGTTNLPAGPKIGHILHALLEEVLDEPKKNTEEYLENRARELAKLSEKELREVGELAKKKKNSEEEKKLAEIRKKYFVK